VHGNMKDLLLEATSGPPPSRQAGLRRDVPEGNRPGGGRLGEIPPAARPAGGFTPLDAGPMNKNRIEGRRAPRGRSARGRAPRQGGGRKGVLAVDVLQGERVVVR
jgi:hypothetical protein